MNKWVMIIGVVVLVGIGAFLFMQSQNKSQTTAPPAGGSVTPTVAQEMTDEEQDSMNVTGTASPSGTTEGVKTGEVVVVKVAGSNFKFDKSQITVKKGDTVRIEFTNSGGIHDWVLDGYGKDIRTKQLQSGQTETIEFVADKSGDFEYYCSVGQHRQMGMVGTLVVTE